MSDFKYKQQDDLEFKFYNPAAILATIISVNVDTKTFTFNYPKEGLKVEMGGNTMPAGGSYSICGKRIVFLEHKKYPSNIISATGHPNYSFPYATLTAFVADADPSKRYYTVKF